MLDLCQVVSGPFGSLLLADLGAEIIRNKHSVAIDLKSECDRQAMCGTLNYTRLTKDTPPVRRRIPIGDLFAGISAATGLTAAVLHRDHTAVGQHVDVSMLDVMLALNTYRVPQTLSFNQEPDLALFEGGQGTVPFGNYECREGWVAICISQRMWPAACRIWGRPDLENDARFVDALTRHARNDQLVALLQGIFKSRSADEWMAEMLGAGVVCAKITVVDEVFTNLQVLACKMGVELTDGLGRTVTVAGDSLQFSDRSTCRPPRRVGADTVMVLTDLLGLGADELDSLASVDVIGITEQPGGVALLARDGVGEAAVGSSPTERPLHGGTVLDLNGDEPSKGFAAQFFADLGARVIRVDRPSGQIIEPYRTSSERPRSGPGSIAANRAPSPTSRPTTAARSSTPWWW